MYNFSVTQLLLVSSEIHVHQMGDLLWHATNTAADMRISYMHSKDYCSQTAAVVMCHMQHA